MTLSRSYIECFYSSRENQKQFAIEDFLHDIGAISIISSSSQVIQ
jgi:urease alpha subunit